VKLADTSAISTLPGFGAEPAAHLVLQAKTIRGFADIRNGVSGGYWIAKPRAGLV